MTEPTDSDAQSRGINNERQVTDPVTHLPITIHDRTSIELEQIPLRLSAAQEKELKGHGEIGSSSTRRHSAMEAVVTEVTDKIWWEDPLGDQNRTKVQTAIVAAAAAGIGAFGGLVLYWILKSVISLAGRGFGWLNIPAALLGCIFISLCVGGCALSLNLVQEPKYPPYNNHEHQVPPTKQHHIHKLNDQDDDQPESAAWLNSFLKSVWPIVNPALFISVSDMLEDSLQANLPKLIHGVRVADIGQGSEPIRIIGIRWLDPGSAAREIDGMKGEEGDFINLEVALAYRAQSTSSTGLRGRSANAHLLTQFMLAGGMVLPVWVELTGMLATARMRIQLTPNPPFLSVLTLTLLGQPKITLKCTPLAKNFLNVMDVPGLSRLLQKSIDAAVAEYVAPQSLNLDLKTLLVGRPKMDTDAVGVVIVTIRRASGFKEGISGNIFKSKGHQKGDAYVTAGWSKWGKPMWSTRIIKKEGNPVWEETTVLLVGPSELNAEECLRLQLWDSDRFTADDLLGSVVVPLKDLMTDPATKNCIAMREDQLTSDTGKAWVGGVLWECGYFDKTSLEQHLAHKQQNAEEIKTKIEQEAEKKLRETVAAEGDNSGEMEQQKQEDLEERGDEIISGSAPTVEWPSGILSIKIEQITGLEVEKIKESGVKDDGEDDDADDLPSAYCTVIINHQRVYKTRIKMKSNNPFFNAGTEKFIRDWRVTTVIIAVRDNRLHETDPLLGVVVLPLREIFEKRSIFIEATPIIGGIGYGRMKLALTFRSIQVQLPRRLLGWDVGTLEIYPRAEASSRLPPDLASCHLVFRTLYSKGKMKAQQGGGWVQKRDHPIRLAVAKRYASCLTIQFRKHVVGPDVTPAFCTLWLKDIPDDEEITVSLPVCRNNDGDLAHAQSNATTDVIEDLGRLELSLRLWPGLSGHHQNMADGNLNMADVMDILDCAEGTQDTRRDLLPTDGDLEEGSSSSSSSVESLDDSKPAGDATGNSKGLRTMGELHRKHRGLMQWKAARNVAWIKRGVGHKAERIGEKITGRFKHHDREVGIETET